MITRKYIELFQNEVEVRKLTERILKEGCVALPDFFDQETFDTLLEYARLLGFEDKSIKWRAGTPAMNVAQSKEVMQVLDAIHKARCEIERKPYTPLQPKQTAVGYPQKNASDQASAVESPFHFDASYINTVFALIMPTDTREGGLLFYPNLRSRIKPRILATVVARLLRHFDFLRTIVTPKEISYQVGALHVFFGDVTLHGVPPTTHGERLVLAINATQNLNVG